MILERRYHESTFSYKWSLALLASQEGCERACEGMPGFETLWCRRAWSQVSENDQKRKAKNQEQNRCLSSQIAPANAEINKAGSPPLFFVLHMSDICNRVLLLKFDITGSIEI